MLALLCFLLGVFLAPVVRPLFKPLFVEIVKLIVAASQELKTASVKVKEEVEDAVAEANAATQREGRGVTPASPSSEASGKALVEPPAEPITPEKPA